MHLVTILLPQVSRWVKPVSRLVVKALKRLVLVLLSSSNNNLSLKDNKLSSFNKALSSRLSLIHLTRDSSVYCCHLQLFSICMIKDSNMRKTS
jgi:hypothetical protein